MIFCISDTHFLHDNVIKYCSRPEDHDARMIRNWNRLVKEGDTVVHLGDFGFKDQKKLREIREKLNGEIIIVKGNHDKSYFSLRAICEGYVLDKHGDRIDVFDPDLGKRWFICATKNKDPRALTNEGIVISHQPLTNIKWPYFYGHVHNNPMAWDDDGNPFPLSLIPGRNLCVEMINYQPVPLPMLMHDVGWIEDNWIKKFPEWFGSKHPKDARSKD